MRLGKIRFSDVSLSVLLTILCLLPSRGVIRTDWIALAIASIVLLLDNSPKISKILLSGGAIALLLIQIVSYLIHFYGFSTLTAVVQFLLTFGMIPLIVFRRLNTQEKVYGYLSAIVYIFAAYSVLGLVEAFTGLNVFEILYGYSIERYAANEIRFGIYRSFGFCTVSINNAMLMNMVWCIANYLVCKRKERKSYVFAWAIIGIYTILILSKAVMMIAVLSQIVLFFRNKKQKLTLKGFVKSLVLVIGVLVLLNSDILIVKYAKNIYIPILNQLLGTGFAYDNSFSAGGFGERMQLASWVIEELGDKWPFGVGYQQKFSHSFVKISASGNHSTWYKESIENTWLFYLYRTGLFGLSGFILYQISCIKKSLKMLKRENERYSISFLMLVISAGYYVLMLTCFAQEDLRFYYILIAVFSAYIRNTQCPRA